MKKSLTRTILISILACLTTIVMGQQIQKKGNVEIHRNTTERGNHIEKLVFENLQNGSKKSFDVARNNPYSNVVSQGKLVDKSSETDTYQIKSTKVRALLNSTSRLKHPEAIEDLVEYIKTEILSIENENHEICGVLYNLYLYDNNYQKRGAEGSIRVFDLNGNLISDIKTSTNVIAPITSNNREYIAFKYGGIENHDEYKVFDSGISLYATSNEKEILNIMGREGYIVSPPFIHNGLIIFTERNGFNEKYFIIKPDERIHYTYTFSYEEIQNLKDITKQGLVFKQGASEKVVEYSSVFSKTSF